MPQRLDRIESGGLDSGKHAEEYADEGGEAKGYRNGPGRDVGLLQLGVRYVFQDAGKGLAETDADEAAEHA